ncbi:MAG: LLM class flavin-dependent oxidoreductase [Acidimicrobiia bacterium]
MDVSLILGEASPLTWERWRHVVQLTERLGFKKLFRSDHYFNGQQKPAIDVYLSFVMAAMETTTLEFGPLVTPVTFRHPTNVGRQAQQLDALSDGRFILGMGAGWYEDEHRIYGVDFPSLTERYDRLDDALAMMQVLWYDNPGHYDGRFYRLDGTDSQPHPPAGRPRILIGGNGPKRTLRTAARFAHEWNSIVLPPDAYRSSVEVLERHCADIDRDPAEIHTSMLLFAITGPDRATEDKVAQRFIDMMGHGEAVTVEDIRQNRTAHPAFVGSQEELIDRLGQLGEAGLQEVVFEHFVTEDDDVPEWLAAEIVPAVAGF